VDTSFTHTRGINANVEIRYYNFLKLFRKSYDAPGDMRGVYAGLNFFYRASRFNNNVFYIKPNNTTNSNDCFWAKKSIWGCNFVFGVQKKVSDGVLIDIFSDLGAMYRASKNFEREYNQKTDYLVTPIDLNARTVFNEASLSENNGWAPSFNIGIRFGVRF
jgi:hypothetical protein